MTKNPADRLGCGPRGIADVQDHPFFASVDWKALLAKKVAAPFKPKINVNSLFPLFFASKMLKWTMYGPLLGVFLENMKNKARNERPGSAQRKRGVSGQKLSGRDVQGIQLRLGS